MHLYMILCFSSLIISVVTEEYMITTINTSQCLGTNVNLNFDGRVQYFQTIKWRIILPNNTKELIGNTEKEQDAVVSGKYKDRFRIFQNGTLRIENLINNDAGLYEREIKNGGTFHSRNRLKVLSPPDGLPTFNPETEYKDENYLHLSCNPPKDLGHPKADVCIVDIYGRVQTSLTITVKESNYSCCLSGEAVDLCFARKAPKCVTFVPGARILKEKPLEKYLIENRDGYFGALIALSVVLIVIVMAVGLMLLYRHCYKGYIRVPTEIPSRPTDNIDEMMQEIDTKQQTHKVSFKAFVQTENETVKVLCHTGVQTENVDLHDNETDKMQEKENKERTKGDYTSVAIEDSPSKMTDTTEEITEINSQTNRVSFEATVQTDNKAIQTQSNVPGAKYPEKLEVQKDRRNVAKVPSGPGSLHDVIRMHKLEHIFSTVEYKAGYNLHKNWVADKADDGEEKCTFCRVEISDSRKERRKHHKIKVLKKGLQYDSKWNKAQKKLIEEVLTKEYISSEESEYDEDGSRLCQRHAKKLIPWESEELSKVKEHLYKQYEKHEKKSRYEENDLNVVHVRWSDEISDRPVPQNAPKWTLKK